jgi:ribonuclease BN (tRNA processing enzyme)
VRLTVLGCRAGMPADGQPSSGYLVETAGSRLLLDCGPGIATALGAVINPTQLDAVIISHLHSDHCYDLLPLGKALLNTLIHHGNHHTPPPDHHPKPLYVPTGATPLLHRWAQLFPVTTMPLLDRAFEVAFAVHEYSPGDRVTVGDCALHMVGLRHAATNCGTRIEAPCGSLAFTGDTGMTDALYTLADSVDLLLAEATLAEPDTTAHGHLSAAEAGRVAARAGAGSLVLTHFTSGDPAWLRSARRAAAAEYTGPITVATAAACIEVAPARGEPVALG